MNSFLVITSSLLIAVLTGEMTLRLTTPFPISEISNRVTDPRLGYRLSPRLPDTDEMGFRNPQEWRPSYRVAAIGDSHTYGNNVATEDSWPRVFEKLTGYRTYNFGVGGYDVFNYHALVQKAVDDGAEYVIVGLYPANDFSVSYKYCSVPNSDFEYWRREIRVLGLRAPSNPEECAPFLKEKSPKGWGEFIVEHSATVSAINYLVVKKLEETFHETKSEISRDSFFHFTAGIGSLKIRRIKNHARLTDVGRSEIRDTLDDFGKMIGAWKELSEKRSVRLGILIIPSRERVVYELMRTQGSGADSTFLTLVAPQAELENMLVSMIRALDIPVFNATDHIVAAMKQALREGHDLYPASGDGHPYEQGYRAYALAAQELLRTMLTR